MEANLSPIAVSLVVDAIIKLNLSISVSQDRQIPKTPLLRFVVVTSPKQTFLQVSLFSFHLTHNERTFTINPSLGMWMWLHCLVCPR